MGAFTYSLANFFILAGWVLLLVATSESPISDVRTRAMLISVSAPIINRISLFDVNRAGDRSTFGVFGYCSSIDVSLLHTI